MHDFDYYLEKFGEIGFVEESVHSLVYASGIPKVRPSEVVIFENGDIGQVLGMDQEYVEILLFSHSKVRVGSKIARTNQHVQVSVGENLLGHSIDPLGRFIEKDGNGSGTEMRYLDVDPPKLMDRRQIEKPLETGVSIVDTVVPLAKGQRQLVIGDRKTGKTEFILQTITTQALAGTVCIYAVIGQKFIDIKKLSASFAAKNVLGSTVIIATSSSDPSGLIFLTPYTAMTLAEYFRDKGMDVLLILDDLTTHARTYREISLLARRFPGRSSYPGDIFYIHARLVERAGNFKKGSITCLPLAESILGDLSGYIQTNLMAMTDGHIFFDIDLYNQGKRPAVNPFLSVTRVGHQTQIPLLRDTSRELSSFLVIYERMKQFLHFGAEVGETAKNVLALGSRIDAFFNQGTEKTVPVAVNLLVLAGLWAGVWNETKIEDMHLQMERVSLGYSTDPTFKKQVDDFLASLNAFSEVVSVLRRNSELITSKIG
ncbi:MAG: ATP synthase subunit alpha [Microgenomates group bacterium GW2011_GWC1_37_8]|uniref:ATP synthase subunit alpha n=2 Tax=Candidatus Woeseibacteriota TaxID=1752722 RepID=A0A0G0KXD8_9BACT|nr:MAG: ATP synthase subunit alpha [Microgenomates group bacterium GW2011_GWC1_37_8]KKQ84318.1 MAG: ATP synthase subunit alpha [Candidatus Woesebacteria bacterium GW2011_GWB1_38_8]OGM21364.1 MAG: hypothetical protein A2863_03150 [Candidatus Woesebacteria bacterium RIFCSPHIGHO2_01_FULL_38_9b]